MMIERKLILSHVVCATRSQVHTNHTHKPHTQNHTNLYFLTAFAFTVNTMYIKETLWPIVPTININSIHPLPISRSYVKIVHTNLKSYCKMFKCIMIIEGPLIVLPCLTFAAHVLATIYNIYNIKNIKCLGNDKCDIGYENKPIKYVRYICVFMYIQ